MSLWNYSRQKVILNTMPNHLKTFTMNEALSDYELFWDNIGNYHGALVQIPSDKLLSIKKEYLGRIVSLNDQDPKFPQYFVTLMADLMENGFDGFGHLSVVPPWFLNAVLYESIQHPDSFPDYSAIRDDSAVAQTSKWLACIFNLIDSSTGMNPNEDESKNIFFEVIDNDIGYIKIKSFDGYFLNVDKNQISAWLESHFDLKNLIIDIQGNGGGSDYYWMENLLPYLLKKDVTRQCYTFVKNWPIDPDCSVLSKLYDEKYLGTQQDWKYVLSLPQIQKDDIMKMTLYVSRQEFARSEKSFPGNIFLLVDEKVYSAASGFVDFCKYTELATIVGESSGGDAGSGLEPVVFVLPNSKLAYWHRIDYAINMDGSSQVSNAVDPDIYVSKDSLKKCLYYIKKKEE